MPLQINITAILVAMLANFIIQMVWYTGLFSKAWGNEMGYDPNLRPDKKTMFKGMALTFVGHFFLPGCLHSI